MVRLSSNVPLRCDSPVDRDLAHARTPTPTPTTATPPNRPRAPHGEEKNLAAPVVVVLCSFLGIAIFSSIAGSSGAARPSGSGRVDSGFTGTSTCRALAVWDSSLWIDGDNAICLVVIVAAGDLLRSACALWSMKKAPSTVAQRSAWLFRQTVKSVNGHSWRFAFWFAAEWSMMPVLSKPRAGRFGLYMCCRTGCPVHQCL